MERLEDCQMTLGSMATNRYRRALRLREALGLWPLIVRDAAVRRGMPLHSSNAHVVADPAGPISNTH